MVIKCVTKVEVETLQREAQRTLSNDYNVHVTMLRCPRLKIVDVTPEISLDNIEDDLRRQNSYILESDYLKVVFVRNHSNKNTKTIFLECSSELFHKCVRKGRVYLQWQNCRIFEDITVPRCYKCQGYNHKRTDCKNSSVCGYCMDGHETEQCSKHFKRCANCTSAKSKYKKNYDAAHEVNDPACPSYKYMLDVVRSKIDYGKQ
ncbi:unnamed protein product [Ceutorhynchus assimilis]|uniref:Gag-like protein n=1 Tax=Ceutorhynchus assimilis TaxID=467358 RepID=A0A9N9MI13_9CUCU|nr:unnamed protein product [Ceutorhynchus assimilis]